MILDASCQISYQTNAPIPAIMMLRPRSGYAQWSRCKNFRESGLRFLLPSRYCHSTCSMNWPLRPFVMRLPAISRLRLLNSEFAPKCAMSTEQTTRKRLIHRHDSAKAAKEFGAEKRAKGFKFWQLLAVGIPTLMYILVECQPARMFLSCSQITWARSHLI